MNKKRPSPKGIGKLLEWLQTGQRLNLNIARISG